MIQCKWCDGTGWVKHGWDPRERCQECGGCGLVFPNPDEGKTPHYRRVEALHRALGIAIPDTPTIPSLEDRVAAARMIFEEALEAVRALGADVVVRSCSGTNAIGEQIRDGEWRGWAVLADKTEGRPEPDLAHIAKEAADCSVVAVRAMVICGIRDEAVLEAVDATNDSKLHGGKPVFRDDGKLLKNPSYVPVDLGPVIEAQRQAGAP
jgi:predicted HAD superfamily Cof-like phosphohydrolase